MKSQELKVLLMNLAVQAAKMTMDKVQVALIVDPCNGGPSKTELTDPGVEAFNVMSCRVIETYLAFLEAGFETTTGMWADPAVADASVAGGQGAATVLAGFLPALQALLAGVAPGTALTPDLVTALVQQAIAGKTTKPAVPTTPVAPAGPPKPSA